MIKSNINNIYSLVCLAIILVIILVVALIVCGIKEEKSIIEVTSTINTEKLNNKSKEVSIDIVGEEKIAEAREVLNSKEYENMPREVDGFKVIGKITIPKIEVEKYILEKTTTESLLVGVTKICGPEINKIGNFCIAGHNYGDTFGWISSLQIGDEIYITDTYDRSVKYQVYEIERVSPYDTSSLSQDTNSEKEITLVTCTLGALKRVIVKAIEVYD